MNLRIREEQSQIRTGARADAAAVHAIVSDLDRCTANLLGYVRVKERVSELGRRVRAAALAPATVQDSLTLGAGNQRLTVRVPAGRASITPLGLHSSWRPSRSLV